MTTNDSATNRQTIKPKTTRTSVSFPSELYETLEAIAKDKKVTVAWIIRDAADKYVSEQWPLFKQEAA